MGRKGKGVRGTERERERDGERGRERKRGGTEGEKERGKEGRKDRYTKSPKSLHHNDMHPLCLKCSHLYMPRASYCHGPVNVGLQDVCTPKQVYQMCFPLSMTLWGWSHLSLGKFRHKKAITIQIPEEPFKFARTLQFPENFIS